MAINGYEGCSTVADARQLYAATAPDPAPLVIGHVRPPGLRMRTFSVTRGRASVNQSVRQRRSVRRPPTIPLASHDGHRVTQADLLCLRGKPNSGGSYDLVVPRTQSDLGDLVRGVRWRGYIRHIAEEIAGCRSRALRESVSRRLSHLRLPLVSISQLSLAPVAR